MPPTIDVIPISDGGASQLADGALILGDSSAETLDCCCSFDGSCSTVAWQDATNPDCPNPARAASNFTGDVFRWSYQGKTDFQTGGGQPWESVAKRSLGKGSRQTRCHRLFVWQDVIYTSNAIDPASTGMPPTYILKTNGLGIGPLGAFETSPGSGTPLDTEPYWWESCQLGGWEEVTATHWFQPTIDYLDRRRATAVGDGTYTVLLLTRHVHHRFQNGNILVPENDGHVRMKIWRMYQTA